MTNADAVRQLASELPKTAAAGIRPCFEIVLLATEPRAQARDGYLAFYDACVTRFARPLRWYQTNTMAQWKPIPESAGEQFHAFLEGRQFAKPGLLGLEQHAGETGSDATPPSFALFSEEVKGQSGKPLRRTFLRACLPVDAAAAPGEMLDLLASALAVFFPYAGYAGYSCYWDVGNTTLERQLEKSNRKLLLGYPGLTYGDLFPFQSFIGFGVLQVSWITLVSAALASRVGGLETLLGGLSPDVRAMPFEDAGVALVAGPEPRLGTRHPDPKDPLRAYRDAGRCLAPVRLEDRYLQHVNLPGFDEDEAREWLLRFFPE